MKSFQEPDLEVIKFEYEDIMNDVTVSGPVENIDSEDSTFWS